MIISTAELSKYFGKEVTPAKMKEQIIALLDEWKEKQPPELAQPDRKKDLASPDSSMLFVAVPWAMSFRTLCFPCGTCRPRYALRIFRPTMPSTYASPRAVSLVVFTDMAIVRREISSSISYTASFLGTIWSC